MERMTIEEIVTACGGTLLCGDMAHAVDTIVTDSRKAAKGSLFVALVGETFDGNDYASSFLEVGDAAIVSREMDAVPNKHLILVKDTRLALGAIAAHYRRKFSVRMVGITGSVGKTSTKDMVASVLSQSFETLKTEGNFNNDIGLPLTAFRLSPQHQAAVLEMGMNAFGEISRLTKIAMPDVAVITNIGTAHIGNLGSQQNILKAKLEILEGLPQKGVVVLNGDDPLLWGLKGTLPFVTCYVAIDNKQADIVAENVRLGADASEFDCQIGGTVTSFTVPIAGRHHVSNALAAIAVGLQFGMTASEMAAGIAAFESGAMRQKVTHAGGVTVIEDCYNASAPSMIAALDVLAQMKKSGRTIAVLGGIGEQGQFAEQTHRQVGEKVAQAGIDCLITVGELAAIIGEQAIGKGMECVLSCKDNEQAAKVIEGLVRDGDTVLFKASRAYQLEWVSDRLIQFLEG